MDIVTHAMMGAVFAAPMMAESPVTASCVLLGSVLPDLDSLSRCCGKRVFLQWHQTYTHGLLVLVASGLASWLAMPGWVGEPWAPVALMAGMLLHDALDLSNTYGIAVFAPFSSKRYCTEWVFFIDSVVLAVSAICLGFQFLFLAEAGAVQWGVAVGYGFFLVLYWVTKVWLRLLAMRHASEGTISLIPSALVPWVFFGAARDKDQVHTFRLSAVSGRTDQRADYQVWDSGYPDLVRMPEFQCMRALSFLYHVTDVEQRPGGLFLRCRDLRVRNFGGRFGELTVLINGNGQIVERAFNV